MLKMSAGDFDSLTKSDRAVNRFSVCLTEYKKRTKASVDGEAVAPRAAEI